MALIGKSMRWSEGEKQVVREELAIRQCIKPKQSIYATVKRIRRRLPDRTFEAIRAKMKDLK